MNLLPKARSKNIVIQELDKELLIYDLNLNKAFCLNETAKTVWQACDGKTTFDEFRSKTSFDFSDELIWFTLEKLKGDNLFDNNEAIVPNFNGLSRREVVRKIGLGSMIALPVIASLVAPSAANALSAAGSCSGACVANGSVVSCAFPGLGNSATCLNNITARCCSGTASSGNCSCTLAGDCSGSVTCGSPGCIASGGTSSGSFPGLNNSTTCLSNLTAKCCSGTASAGSCSCTPAGDCSGNVTCS